MNRTLFLSPLLCFAFLGLAPVQSIAAAPAVNADPSPDNDADYAAGTRAMDERRWPDAILAFDKVINAKGKRADAALYWKAYALNKLDKQQLVTDTCLQLRTQFKESAWNEDCRALTLAVRINQRVSERIEIPAIDFDVQDSRHGRQKDPDADIKMLALNAVMRENPGQAIPLLRNLLSGDQPASVKQHAFFVLAQSKSPEADGLMHDLILGKMGPELQLQAIQSSGIYRGRTGNDSLTEVYRNTTDVKVKHAVIAAFFVSGDDTHLVELARQEKDLELKHRMVSQLSIMHGKAASDYMMELLK